MAIQINGQQVGPVKFTDDKTGRTLHIGTTQPANILDGDVWIDSDTLNNAGKNLISTTTLTSGASKTITVSPNYKDVYVVIRGLNITLGGQLNITVNSATNYIDVAGLTSLVMFGIPFVKPGIGTNFLTLTIPDAQNTVTSKMAHVEGFYTLSTSSATVLYNNYAIAASPDAISSLTFSLTTGAFASGSILMYGVN